MNFAPVFIIKHEELQIVVVAFLCGIAGYVVVQTCNLGYFAKTECHLGAVNPAVVYSHVGIAGNKFWSCLLNKEGED